MKELRAKLDAWDLSKVKARAIEDGHYTATEIDRIESLYKDFMYACMTTKTRIGVFPEVDELWHTHILFTRDYARFCREVGGKFIHHTPSEEQHGFCGNGCIGIPTPKCERCGGDEDIAEHADMRLGDLARNAAIHF